MANLNQIELPNGGTYNFEDTEGRKEENLQWGGNSHAGEVSPIGMSLSNEHSANRIAYINGASLYFEYSSDSGSSWTNYGYSDAIKSQFCTTSYGVPIGRTSFSTNYSTSSRTRITLTAQNGTTGFVYTNPRKMLINISSSGGMQVLVETRTGTNYQGGGAWSTFGTYTLSGWSGWNDIPLILGTLGGGTSQTNNNWQLRLTFIMTSFNSSYPTTAQVSAIRIYGENSWQTTSNMGATGHLYSYDASQNAVFPANVKINNGKQVGYLTTTPTSGQVIIADGTSGGIKTSGYTIAKSVPSDAQFTDNNTTYTFANGTNGFTVTPSGGSAQTVTVTPSITNNVTGSGTSGYIAKFNGANTITNGPAIGSGTTKFLREDGTWQTPSSGSGTVTSVTIKGSSPISVDSESAITTSGTRTISHANSGATAGSYGDSSAQTPNYGGTFKVPYVTVNATGHITGISEHTVKIPASDNTNTTYTFANGTNGFTVTPSGGSAQTVTVTPSIANNVTGSGTSGCIAKFSGANTVTDGPAFGSSITNFLAENGQWRQPPNDMVQQYVFSAPSSSKTFPILTANSGITDSDYDNTETNYVRKQMGLEFDPYDKKLYLTYASDRYITLSGYEIYFRGGNTRISESDISTGDIYAEGEIETETNLRANKVFCNSMSVTDISDQYTFTKTSGNWKLNNILAYRCGNVIHMGLIFRGGGSSVSAGSIAFQGSLTGGPLPVIIASGTRAYTNHIAVVTVEANGSITARTAVENWNYSTTSDLSIPITFITND